MIRFSVGRIRRRSVRGGLLLFGAGAAPACHATSVRICVFLGGASRQLRALQFRSRLGGGGRGEEEREETATTTTAVVTTAATTTTTVGTTSRRSSGGFITTATTTTTTAAAAASTEIAAATRGRSGAAGGGISEAGWGIFVVRTGFRCG